MKFPANQTATPRALGRFYGWQSRPKTHNLPPRHRAPMCRDLSRVRHVGLRKPKPVNPAPAANSAPVKDRSAPNFFARMIALALSAMGHKP